jgi:heterodisulfide reductase subunit A-like polyferredoxin
LDACKEKSYHLLIRLSGTNHRTQIESTKFPKTYKEISIPYLIVGGGISGLSAARQLAKKGTNFLMVELEDHLGGNSSNGENKYSNILGAHYLPLPNLGQRITAISNRRKLFWVMTNGYPDLMKPNSPLLLMNVFFTKTIARRLVPKQGNSALEDQELSRF